MPASKPQPELPAELADLLIELVGEVRALRAELAGRTPDTPGPMSIPAAARKLGVSSDTVQRLIKAGAIPAKVVGQGGKRARRTIAPEDLDRFLASRSTAPPPPKKRRRKTGATPNYL